MDRINFLEDYLKFYPLLPLAHCSGERSGKGQVVGKAVKGQVVGEAVGACKQGIWWGGSAGAGDGGQCRTGCSSADGRAQAVWRQRGSLPFVPQPQVPVCPSIVLVPFPSSPSPYLPPRQLLPHPNYSISPHIHCCFPLLWHWQTSSPLQPGAQDTAPAWPYSSSASSTLMLWGHALCPRLEEGQQGAEDVLREIREPRGQIEDQCGRGRGQGCREGQAASSHSASRCKEKLSLVLVLFFLYCTRNFFHVKFPRISHFKLTFQTYQIGTRHQ